jgi:hypothetical protein
MVGPEGSLLCFVVIGVVWVAFERVYPEIRYRVTSIEKLTSKA